MHGQIDVSSFYFANEQVGREIQRLLEAGVLDDLVGLLNQFQCQIFIESRREEQGLSELVGCLSGVAPKLPARTRSAPRSLPLYQPDPEDPLLRANAQWNVVDFLTQRSQFSITRRDGKLEEVYMPDHICPECLNEEDNKIDACERVCALCGFGW